jgi:sigma-B regulation protein RsbU (phosphoserine phosphatase)
MGGEQHRMNPGEPSSDLPQTSHGQPINGVGQAAPDPSPVPLIRVLLIEDNPSDAHLIQAIFGEAAVDGFVLERAERLAHGIDRLAAGGIDSVLLDLSLPDSHGLETFSRLHAEAPGVPIIVLSGLEDETVAVSAVHQGAQDYLVKGHVDGHVLVRAIRYAIERKRTADQLARYAAELRSRNSQMEADLHMAREIQQVFLPQQYPTFPRQSSPEQSALRFCHRYQPAATVSGDFFNILYLSDSEAGVLICDVMGHGLRAALVTAILRGLMEELMPLAGDAGRFLTGINRSLVTILRRLDDPLLSTALYLIADAGRNEARFASAGHPSPLRVQRPSGIVEPLRAYDARHGPALGLFEESAYPTCRCPLSAGDVLVLFTDGVYEMHGPEEEEFGLDRLMAAFRRRSKLPPAQMLDEILEEVQSFSRQKEFEDDICLVTVERAR